MRRRLAIMLLLGVTGVFVPTAAGAQTLPPSLSGVRFLGDPASPRIFQDYDFDAATVLTGCDPAGTSTISFTESGPSTGAYAGTYTETVELTIGPQAAGGGATPGVLQGAVTTLTATFSIDSPAGQVTGTKSLSLAVPSVGSCYTAEAADGSGWSREALLDYVHEHRALSASATYAATIVTSDGTFTDAGTAFLRFNEGGFRGICDADQWCDEGTLIQNFFVSQTGFEQFFFQSQGVVPVDTNEDPDCTGATASAAMLWPPDHRFVPIEIGGVTDADGDPVAITVDSIDQDEPVNDEYDGDTGPDGMGVGTDGPEVRAERSGEGDGRVYHIGFTADDGQGGACTGEVTVAVPLSSRKNGGGPVDGGALYDSTSA